MTDRITDGSPFYPLLILACLNLVEELDRTAFNVLTPNIRAAFHLRLEGILAVVALAGVAALLVELPIAYFADRSNRVRIASTGALIWGAFSVLTGLAPALWVLGVARAGSGLGKSVITPTHNSLLSDYYEVTARPKVFGFHRGANSLGQFIGPLSAGLLAYYFGWRTPFVLFIVPTAAFAILAWRLREPTRGAHERKVMGASEENVNTEEIPPSYAESFRILWQVRSLRRIWFSLPFLSASLIGLGALTSLFYKDVFHLSEVQRGFVAAGVEPAQLAGLLIGIPVATRLANRDPGLVLKLLGLTGILTAAAFVVFVRAPNLTVAIIANALVTGILAVTGPGILSALSLAIPPRARSMGFSVGSLWILPGLIILPIIGGISDAIGIRLGLLFMIPIFITGAAIIASAGSFMAADVDKVRTSTTAIAEARAARLGGDPKALIVRGLDVSYGQTQVLFGVDFEVSDGEIVALLGTNGAGKSTLLNAISGSLEAAAGAIIFDGRDTTYMPADLVAANGVVLVPGGRGVFPGLTVAENLNVAGWLFGKDSEQLAADTQRVLRFFPILTQRWDLAAGNLSGGEQQMLTLAQAFIARPKLLMIDELSLGLAPRLVEELLKFVRAINEAGTTVILVEQSVNVALTVTKRAVYMEKGEIRFDGPTADLLERPDILRSAFLKGASAALSKRLKPQKETDRSSLVALKRKQHLAVSPVGVDRRTVLSVRDLQLDFGGVPAVNGVGLSVREGEILGLIGPNGAGKTTTFDLISGFLKPKGGQIFLDGVDVTTWSPDARARWGLGRSFQDARLFPSMTVTQSIATALERHVQTRDPIAAAVMSPATRLSEQRVTERVDELIELLHLEAFNNKFISELSTGTRRIVELACALGHEPKILLLDEPSSGIAQRETEALGPMLLDIREKSRAALLVIEHDMPLITAISDEIIALDLGRVIAQGSQQEVMNDPAVIASYLGTSQEIIQRSGARRSKQSRPTRRRTPRPRPATRKH